MSSKTAPPWPHAPVHRLTEAGVYFVTAGTYLKEHFFRSDDRLKLHHDLILTLADKYQWQLEAWCVLSNHYHFVARSPNTEGGAASLKEFLSHLHSTSSRELNKLDGVSGRKVWHNFRETQLTYEKSYFARLNYVHRNAVKHELVAVANQYPWCSAAWFEGAASPAMVNTIYGFKTDRLQVDDDF